MNQFKGTPGKWHVDGYNTTSVIAEMGNVTGYKHVCDCNYGYSEPEKHIELNKANATLIAAAPEMLAMLQDIAHEMTELGTNAAVLHRIKSIITKATTI